MKNGDNIKLDNAVPKFIADVFLCSVPMYKHGSPEQMFVLHN